MMRKIFGQFFDKPDSAAGQIAESLGVPVSDLLSVRVVSHHLRLLGILARKTDADWLVLVDYNESN